MYSENSSGNSDSRVLPKMEQPKPRKWYLRWWGVLTIALLTFLLVIIVAYAFYIYFLTVKLKNNELDVEKFLQGGAVLPRQQLMDQVIGDGHLSLGLAEAPVVIAVFADYQCPACREAAYTLKSVLDSDGFRDKLRVVYRNFPIIDIHPDSVNAALAAECANEQKKFSEMHQALYDHQDKLTLADIKKYGIQLGFNSVQFSACLESQQYMSKVQNDFNDGVNLGVEATPTFFIEGEKIAGAINKAALEQIISQIYEQKNAK